MSLSIERTLGQTTYPQPLTVPQVAPRTASKPRVIRRSRLICPETAVLFLLCMADALSSAWLFHAGLATEANPLLRTAAEAGVATFLLVKLSTFVPALLAAEWWRRQRPTVVPALLRWVIFAYIAIFTVSVAGQFLG